MNSKQIYVVKVKEAFVYYVVWQVAVIVSNDEHKEIAE